MNTVSLERKDITITMMMGVTPLTPYQSCFVLGDSNGDETRSRRIRPLIHHDPVSKTIHRNWIIGTRTIHPSMSLVVDGEGSEIPGITQEESQQIKRGQASKVRDQDEQ